MATLDDLKALGYSVTLAFDDVFCVSCPGLSTYVRADNVAEINDLADPVRLAERTSPQPEPTLQDVRPTPAFVAALDPKTASLADVIAVVNALTGAS